MFALKATGLMSFLCYLIMIVILLVIMMVMSDCSDFPDFLGSVDSTMKGIRSVTIFLPYCFHKGMTEGLN